MNKVHEFPNRPVVPPAHLRARLHEECPSCSHGAPCESTPCARSGRIVALAVVLAFAALTVAWVVA